LSNFDKRPDWTGLPSTNENRKRKIEEEPKERRTRGKRVDYRTLNDPFPDELDEQGNLIVDSDHDQIYAITAGDEHNSLKEAKASYDWPEWQHAMDIEHNQLLEMGTWKLIEPPPNAIPIANKWVYIKKHDQLGKLRAAHRPSDGHGRLINGCRRGWFNHQPSIWVT
jgi:hypothetical protein